MKRLLAATAMAALLLAGCADGNDNTTTAGGGGEPAAAPVPAEARTLLATYGLDGKSTVEIVDHLDRLAVERRPADLKASVRPDVLVISSGGKEFRLGIPADRFYLSVAPYIDRTHECFYHSLTTCTGELAGREVGVKIVDKVSGKVVVDDMRTTFTNGFVGLWLPRDLEGTLRLTYGAKVGETTISTGTDAPTCLTTLRLA